VSSEFVLIGSIDSLSLFSGSITNTAFDEAFVARGRMNGGPSRKFGQESFFDSKAIVAAEAQVAESG
jgi:hypothetical protein